MINAPRGNLLPRGCKHSQRKMFTMSILKRFDQDGLEILIDTNSGESFASVNGYARMSGKAKSTISQRLQGVSLGSPKTAQILTEGGLQGVRLITEDMIVEWLPKDNPTMASQLMKLGVRLFLHQCAGYSYQSQSQSNEYRPSRALLASREVKEIHENVEDISPRLKQFLIDCCINEVIENRLPSTNEPKLRGVVEIAQEMGFKVDHSNRSNLGRFVKSALSHLAQSEKRLCNGTEREIAVYPDSDEVRERISQFFD